MSNSISRGALRAQLASLGPGIIAASAAIGGSHLVSSTQAGALYGWSLAGLIVLINLMKYPFFLAGVRYTLSSGQDLVTGYRSLGRAYVPLLWLLEVFGGITSVAACCVFAATILRAVLPGISMTWACLGVIGLSAAVLIAGRYRVLSLISKVLVVLLSVLTVGAVVLAGLRFGFAAQPPSGTPAVSAWSFASLGFIVMLMGWMPCPLDLTPIQSVWVTRQRRAAGATRSGQLFDFHLGYAVTTVMAVVFLALGAIVMHSQAIVPSKNGMAFTAQLIDLYAQTVGAWSRPFMALMAFACIWGSAVTVMDGYARVIAVCQLHLRGRAGDDETRGTVLWILIESACAALLIVYFKAEMLVLLQFAMVSAFCTTPVLAWLNYRLVTRHLPPAECFGPTMRAYALAGLIFLWAFLAVFCVWYLGFIPSH